MQYSEDSKNDSTDLTILASSLPQNTANRLTTISAKAVELLRFVHNYSETSSCLASKDMYWILNTALDVDFLLEDWAKKTPQNWAWETASGFKCPLDYPCDFFVYGRRVDFYSDLHMASIWNSYRSTRIKILSAVLKCISKIEQPINSSLFHQAMAATRTIQEIADDICASVPYQFGTKVCGGTTDNACVEYPYYANKRLSSEQRRQAAALAGWFLLNPLKSCLEGTSLRQGQKEWVRAQLMRVSNCYRVKPPTGCQ